MDKINSTDDVEIWRPVVGAETAYEVSSLGRVKSLPRSAERKSRFFSYADRASHTKKASILTIPGKMMTWTIVDGYPRVTLRIGGKTIYRMCHALVAEAFLGPRPDGQEVRHKNGDRGNPSLSNIEYGTRAQNIADSKRHGTFKNGSSNLTDELVRQIASRHDDTAATLAAEFGVSPSTIAGIRCRRIWTHLNLDLRESYVRRGDAHPARRGKQSAANEKP